MMDERNRLLERTLAEIQRVVAKFTGGFEGNREEEVSEDEVVKLSKSVSSLCPTYGCQLYLCYEKIFQTYYRQTVLPCVKNKDGEQMLRELCHRWNNHKEMVSYLCKVFGDLAKFAAQWTSDDEVDKSLYSHVLSNRKRDGAYVARLEELAMITFRDQVLVHTNSEATVVVLKMVSDERHGVVIDQMLIRSVCDIYVECGSGIYERDLESSLLQDTKSHYSSKASSWVIENSFPDYLLKLDESVDQEKERVAHYLHSSTEPKLVEVVQNELLVSVENQLLEKESSCFRSFLSEDKKDDLSRMFRHYHAFPKRLEPFADIFRLQVTAKGDALIQHAEDARTKQPQDALTSGGSVKEKQVKEKQVKGKQAKEKQVKEEKFLLIRKLIALHDHYMVYVTGWFHNLTLFHKALEEAFIVFCNRKVGEMSIPELISVFCDDLLKEEAGNKDDDSTVESTIDTVVTLLDFTKDKDLFQEFYRKKLANRLLIHHNVSQEHVRSLLTKLKEKFGVRFTDRIEGMVSDMALAKERHNGFQEYVKNGDVGMLGGVDLNVTVLNRGFWPSFKRSDVNLPPEMAQCIEAFRAYYGTITQGRKLEWIYGQGMCHILGRFDSKPLELIVTTSQALVLYAFNDTERLTFQELIEQVKLSHEDLVSVLHSLSCSVYNILKKEPASKIISETDTFVFNSKFTSTKYRIRVRLPSLPQGYERKKVVEDVDRDRRYTIDACLARIMKSRKVLPHQQLIAECVEELSKSFKPDIVMMKKRIEDLISRDYLERDPENHNTYKYLP